MIICLCNEIWLHTCDALNDNWCATHGNQIYLLHKQIILFVYGPSLHICDILGNQSLIYIYCILIIQISAAHFAEIWKTKHSRGVVMNVLRSLESFDLVLIVMKVFKVSIVLDVTREFDSMMSIQYITNCWLFEFNITDTKYWRKCKKSDWL